MDKKEALASPVEEISSKSSRHRRHSNITKPNSWATTLGGLISTLFMLSSWTSRRFLASCHEHTTILYKNRLSRSSGNALQAAFHSQTRNCRHLSAKESSLNGWVHISTGSSTNKRHPQSLHTSISSPSSSRLAMSTSTEQEVDIAANMAAVREKMQTAMDQRSSDDASSSSSNVRLVAVSKTKPLELLQRAYDEADCRVFGENYVQELVDKAPALKTDDDPVYWHYIGNLQSNKVNLLLSPFLPSESNDHVNKLHSLVLETVDSVKLARKLNGAIERSLQAAGAGETTNNSNNDPYKDNTKLKVFVQVNTSGEASKSGVAPVSSSSAEDDSVLLDLCREIVQACPHLHLQGLMTIGAPGDASAFDVLVECRSVVQDRVLPSSHLLELSMGMSGDYEMAIAKGSTNVRVGSSIFGARDYSNKK